MTSKSEGKVDTLRRRCSGVREEETVAAGSGVGEEEEVEEEETEVGFEILSLLCSFESTAPSRRENER